MKIGILTQPLQPNYGALLQNYALQQVLIHEGHDVETIDWKVPTTMRVKIALFRRYVFSMLFPKYFQYLYLPSKKEEQMIRMNINSFVDTNIKHTNTIYSKNGFYKQGIMGKYDAYIVGSDQCWRPCYNPFLLSMFLDFEKRTEVKRLAYAASFGTGHWEYTPKMTKKCATLAQMFDFISVREDSGVKLCHDYLGVDAFHVLDPTMLLSKEDYINLIKHEPASAGRLLNYILDPNPLKSAFIQRIAEATSLKSFQILPKYYGETRTKEDIKKHIEDCIYPGVTTWLRAFMDSEMTIVDSFHGMVFSIIFNKPFWVIGNEQRGMSRFTSLLKVFQLENRLLNIDNLNDIDINQAIDWNNVNAILEYKRSESKSLLTKQLHL